MIHEYKLLKTDRDTEIRCGYSHILIVPSGLPNETIKLYGSCDKQLAWRAEGLPFIARWCEFNRKCSEYQRVVWISPTPATQKRHTKNLKRCGKVRRVVRRKAGRTK